MNAILGRVLAFKGNSAEPLQEDDIAVIEVTNPCIEGVRRVEIAVDLLNMRVYLQFPLHELVRIVAERKA